MPDNISTPKPTRKEVVEALGRGQGINTRSLIGKAFDYGQASAIQDGFRDGFETANHYASKAVTASFCMALHREFGFGMERMQRVCDAFQQLMLETLDVNELVDEVEERFKIVLVSTHSLD